MKNASKFAWTLCLLGLGGFADPSAKAQTTDGYHTILVFPVVVDTASFSQRFSFRNPDPANAVTVAPIYFPASGTSQPASISCPSFSIPANGESTFTSLRQICPSLLSGSQFGFLYTSESDGFNRPYAAFSRVSNPAGQGFSVEAFPAHTFTSADAVVTGIRRLAATGSSPAFQTNCFVGNMNEVTAAASPVISTVKMYINNSAGVQIGLTTTIPVAPGKLTRLLDVFAVGGVPAGDYDNARVLFTENGSDEPGLITFCTVQDNSSFGADFRIGKQERGFNSPFASVGAQDDHVSRASNVLADMPVAGEILPRAFNIPPGDFSNTHVMYFRHPDWVRCEVIDPVTTFRALDGYGLEMRMLADDGVTVIAGGNDLQGFGPIYLGDKADQGNGGNSRYTIEVESNGQNPLVNRPYTLRCHTGSGHTAGDMIRFNQPLVRF
ncbi:MAG: hypothetical protein NT117_07465 [Gammaproteobacteria bacterium]|nr:hypothetical protein [Gammaproteobacteria bacterium]